jgi:DNA-binding NarL/FixJ family response regulator
MPAESIWIINDDGDDHELILDIMDELKIENEVVFFRTAREFLKKLEAEDTAPFLIMCDVNIPGTDGFALREILLKSPNKKYHSVPFIFWSTFASDEQVEKAYRLRAHGFFIKEGNFEEWKDSFSGIIKYWSKSKMPAKKERYEPPLKAS